MKNFGVGFVIGAGLHSSFSSTLGLASRKVNDLGSDIKGLEKIKAHGDKFFKLRADVRATEKDLAAAQRKAQALGRELAQTEKPTKALRQEQAAAAARVAALKEKLDGQRHGLKGLRNDLQKAGVATQGLAQRNTALEKTIDRLKKSQAGLAAISKAQQANSARRSELQGRMMGAVGLAVSVGAPVKQAMDFESAMADVRKVVDFPTPQAFKEMGQDILAMTTDKRIPMAADGIASIVAAAGQAGIAKSRAELLGFAEDAAKMGVAFDIDAAAAGKMMADWRAGMSLNQTRAVSLANAVNFLSNNMNANAGELGEVLQRQGAVAKAAGLTEIQTASLGAALLSSGTGPERAATALKNFTGALTHGKAATSAQRESFAALGLDAEEMAAKMQQDAPAAIREVMKALSEAPVEERNSLVSELFGEESKGAIMPLLTNLTLLDQAFGLTANATAYAGSMQAEYDQRAKTSANGMIILRNQITRLGINLGTILLPPLNFIGAGIGWVADKTARLTQMFPVTSGVVVGLAASAAGLAVVTTALGYVYTFVQGGILGAQKAWLLLSSGQALARAQTIGLAIAQKSAVIATNLWTGAQWLLNVAMNANPIGLVVAGALALGAAAYFVYSKWEPIKNFFVGIGNWFNVQSWYDSGRKLVTTLASGIWDAAKLPFTAAKNVLGKVRNLLPFSDAKEGPLSQLTLSGRKIMETMAGGVAGGGQPMRQKMEGALSAGVGAAKLPFTAAKNVLSKVRNLLPFSDAKEGPLSQLTLSGRKIMETMAGGIAVGGQPMRQKMEGALSGVGAALPSTVGPGGGTAAAGALGSITFSPTVYVGAGAPHEVRAQVDQALQISERRLREMVEQILTGKNRLSYGH